MQKRVIHKPLAILSAVLILLSTITLTVEKHFCGGHLVDVAFFGSAHKCSYMSPLGSSETTQMLKSCCTDTVDIIQGQDELQSSKLEFDKQLEFSGSAFIFKFKSLNYEYLKNLVVPYQNYRPPNIVRDIHLIDETFLI